MVLLNILNSGVDSNKPLPMKSLLEILNNFFDGKLAVEIDAW